MSVVHIRGFSSFGDMDKNDDNPTMQIVEALKQELDPSDLQGTHSSFTFEVLPVSKTGVDDYLSRRHLKLGNISIHLGVNTKGDMFQLETASYNNMDFRIPDVDGYQPQSTYIDESKELKEPFKTNFNLKCIARKLGAEGFDAPTSEDPVAWLAT